MNQLQRKQFELLSCFVRLCETLHIPYFLVCGSALGAVKYGGFIPWDDDVDVALLRPDYNRFLQEAPALLPEGLFLQTFRSDPAYPNVFAKLRDSRTTFVEKPVAHLPMNHGVFMDIFPLDGYPESKREQKRLERRKKYYKRLLLSAFEGNFSLKVRSAIRVMRMLGIHRKTGKILERYENLISAYDVRTSSLLCNHGNWQRTLDYTPREQFGEGMIASFEGLQVRIPSDAERYLTRKYGDFRKDPPSEDQKGHHYSAVMDLQTPYDVSPAYAQRRILCLAHYDVPNGGEERVCHPAAYTKVNYLFHCFVRLGYSLHVLSASQTRGEKSVGKRVVQLDKMSILELLRSGGRGNPVKNGVNRVFFQIRLFARLMRLVKDGDTLWAYHSLGLMTVLRWLKRCKDFRLILEMEEIYGDVRCSKRISRREKRFSRIADAYLFPTEKLNELVNSTGKPHAISHGTYRVAPSPAVDPPDDGKIHVVYAGTLDPRKGGAFAAMEAARYLPTHYHIHILGTGTSDEVTAVKAHLREISEACSCTLTYDGVLRDEAYTDFLHGCHIGLSTQDPTGAFNETSFPSKILSYMACGLRVVSARISVVEQSDVGQYVYYYQEHTPAAIAAAIRSVDFSDGYNGKELLGRLDTNFLHDLSLLLGSE